MKKSALKLEETATLNATLKNFEKVLNDTCNVMEEAGYSNDFIQTLKRTYTSFDFDSCKNRIDADRWEKLIKSVNFIECSEKEKLIKKYSFEYPYHSRDYSAPCYLQNAEKKLIQFEQRKEKYIKQLGISVLDSLFKSSVRKSKYKTIDHDFATLPEKLKMVVFHEMTEYQNHYLSNQKRASYFLENLDNFINWLYEADHGLKKLIEENWVYKNLKSGEQKMEFKTKFMAIKIFKNGNCDLTFKRGFLKDLNIIKSHIDSGGDIKDAKKIIQFEQVIKDFGLKKCKPFELGNGSKIFKFLIRGKEARVLAGSSKVYVSCAGNKLKCDYDNGSFHRLFENIRKCLIPIKKDVVVEQKVTYLYDSETPKNNQDTKIVELKNLLDKEYKCELSIYANCMSGHVLVQGKKFVISVDDTLQIFSEGFEQKIDIAKKKSKAIFGYIKVVFASCQLLLDDCAEETKRIVPRYHIEEISVQDTSVIPIGNFHSKSQEKSISITHSDSDGTIVKGDTKPAKDLLKGLGFSWFDEGKFWYVRGSRRRIFCDESRNRCDNLSTNLKDQGYQVMQHYPRNVSTLVN